MKIELVRDYRIDDQVKTRTWSEHDAQREKRVDEYHRRAMKELKIDCDCEVCQGGTRMDILETQAGNCGS